MFSPSISPDHLSNVALESRPKFFESACCLCANWRDTSWTIVEVHNSVLPSGAYIIYKYDEVWFQSPESVHFEVADIGIQLGSMQCLSACYSANWWLLWWVSLMLITCSSSSGSFIPVAVEIRGEYNLFYIAQLGCLRRLSGTWMYFRFQ